MPNLLKLADQHITQLKQEVGFFDPKETHDAIEKLNQAIEEYKASLIRSLKPTKLAINPETHIASDADNDLLLKAF